MSTTSQTTDRTLSDEETLHLARLGVIGKIADKHPRFKHIDDHEHPILIGTTREGAGVFLVWTPWGLTGEHTEAHYEAAHEAIDAHKLAKSPLHVYSRYNLFHTDGVIWHPTTGDIEPHGPHADIDAIDRHFAVNPRDWALRKSLRTDTWEIIDIKGRILFTAETPGAAHDLAVKERQRWKENHSRYLQQPGTDPRWRPLTPHERAYIQHAITH